jgi:hypothetical protein
LEATEVRPGAVAVSSMGEKDDRGDDEGDVQNLLDA